ncbi:MAG: right-handed parallel beta-helix repeat-containing protein [Pyrinomonadaceae bacterium]
MTNSSTKQTRHRGRFVLYLCALAALLSASLYAGGPRVEANHPVLLEGNCDSPVPGTTLVSPGTCGDFDGDGRIGTAEDTDGADRIFGTLRAALGPGTGAAAGTGANQNGSVLIVASGRFAEGTGPIIIGVPPSGFEGQGSANPGNVTIEAAPGVIADIDAVLQGDPAGGNTTRQMMTPFLINYPPSAGDRTVTLRNLIIRNWAEGIGIANSSRVHIDRCRFENNLNFGVHIIDNARVVITNSQIESTGFRIPVTGPPSPGAGIAVQNNSQLRIMDSVVNHNFGPGILNQTLSPANVVLYKVGTFFNNPDTSGAVTIAANPNTSN